jgi:hypothetical protein
MYAQTVLKRFILPLFACCLGFAACTMEEEMIPGANGDGAANKVTSEARVEFSLTIPSRMQVQTRAAMEDADESKILSVRVLMFKETEGVMRYCFGVTKSNILVVDPSLKSFDVTLPTGEYDVVILANAQEALAQNAISLGDTKENVLRALVETNVGKWNRDYIPMWGRIDRLSIDAETGAGNNNTVEMVRMAARIDLEVTPSAAADFSLTSVRLYNYSSQGALVPDPSNLGQANLVSAPTQPAAAGGYAPVSTPLLFDAADGVRADGCERAIYLYETPAGRAESLQTNACLVVGGSYKGGAETYYRIDFVGMENGQKVFLPLLRNNYYPVKIANVSSNGYDTPEEALALHPMNIETIPLNWTQKGANHVVFDGNYMLGVSTNRMFLPSDLQTTRAAAYKLTIVSNVPSGFTIEKITDRSNSAGTADWLYIYPVAPTAAGEVFVCVQENTSSVERTGYIHIRSGRLWQRIEVVQSPMPSFSLEIVDEATWQEVTMLDFGPASGVAKTFRITWKPIDATVTFTRSTLSGYPTFSGTTTLPKDNSSFTSPYGWMHYTVTSSGSKSATKITRLDFTVTDGTDVLVKTLYLRQGK